VEPAADRRANAPILRPLQFGRSSADADGVPVGVQLVTRPHGEATIVALAAQMEGAAPE
jgi:Asp-tRNA(Asn)/Glu-tRNA(Gln) amidotransferase A subunit family amidase